MSNGAVNILIVEDEAAQAQMVRFYLEREGFAVESAESGPAGEQLYQRLRPQLVIMDVNLPGFDGLELCRRLRQVSASLPIMLLTGRDADTDKAIGLGIGADDYLTKPFSPVELVARVRALLRRAQLGGSSPAPAVVRLGGPRLLMEPGRRLVTLDERPLELTPTEFKLLRVLLENPGWVIGRDMLLEKVWGYQDEAGEETVTAHMSNLRRKLGQAGASLVRTVRGGGYLYEETEEN